MVTCANFYLIFNWQFMFICSDWRKTCNLRLWHSSSSTLVCSQPLYLVTYCIHYSMYRKFYAPWNSMKVHCAIPAFNSELLNKLPVSDRGTDRDVSTKLDCYWCKIYLSFALSNHGKHTSAHENYCRRRHNLYPFCVKSLLIWLMFSVENVCANF